MVVGIGEHEYVVHAFAQGDDLGVLHADVEIQQDAAHARQQTRSVRRAELKNGVLAFRRVEDRHFRGKGEMLELARYPALNDRRIGIRVGQRFN